MTSIINNSNANSALINTLESSDSMTNPNVYSTKEIYPMSATTWTTNQKSNGVSTAGNQMNFNLNKYHYIIVSELKGFLCIQFSLDAIATA